MVKRKLRKIVEEPLSMSEERNELFSIGIELGKKHVELLKEHVRSLNKILDDSSEEDVTPNDAMIVSREKIRGGIRRVLVAMDRSLNDLEKMKKIPND